MRNRRNPCRRHDAAARARTSAATGALASLDGTASRRLADYPVLAFIGGFAFGDHLGAGVVTAAPRLRLVHHGRVVVDADVLELKRTWKETLAHA